MKVPVELTPRQIRSLQRAARAVCLLADTHDLGVDFDVTCLRRVGTPLQRALDAAICAHCQLRDASRADGLCDRCHVYERTYGRKPERKTLVRTLIRESA